MASVKEINDYLNRLPAKIASAPLDEQIAYYSILLGILLIVIWFMIKIIF